MNAIAILAVVGIVILSLAWVVAVDWCVVGIVRGWHHRKIIRDRMTGVLGRKA